MNNAGYANTASVEDITDADFREQIDTNLFGVVNVSKAALGGAGAGGGARSGSRSPCWSPGGMRTEWAGSSMKTPPVSGPYEQTVGQMVTMPRSGIVTTAVGDPAKVADVVLTVADLDEPPVRLLLGSDAVNYGEQVARARAESDTKWRDLSVSTDHDDVTQTDVDPLAR